MRLPASGWLAAGALGAAALMFTGAGLPELAQDGRAPRSNPTQDGRPPTQERPQVKDSDVGNDGPGAADMAASDAGSGILAPTDDVLRIVPDEASAHAVRGTDSLRLRGWFWMARPAPKGETGSLGPREQARVTLHALDLTDTARDRRIRAEGIRLIPGVIPSRERPSTVVVNSLGVPVRWTAVVPLAGARSGTYRGHLLATRETEAASTARSPVAIPVVVRIKDAPWAALAILLLGLPLVLLLRWYRDRRQQPDSAYDRIARLDALVGDDELLDEPDGAADPFRRRFAQHLRAAAGTLETGTPPGDTAGANGHLTKAEALWAAWKGGQPDWEAGLRLEWGEIQALESLAAAPPPSVHVKALLAAAKTGHAGAPEVATAAQYRQEAEVRAARAQRYRDLTAVLTAVRVEADGVPPEKKTILLAALATIEKAWNDVANPSDDTATDEKLAQLRSDVEKARADAGLGDRRPSPPAPELAPADDPAPRELLPPDVRRLMRAARERRRAYGWTVMVIVYLVLVFFGLKETWGASPVFGADRLADYLSVFAWALGLNALTLAGVAAFTGRLSLPWASGSGAEPAEPAANEDVVSPESVRAPRRWARRPPAPRRQ